MTTTERPNIADIAARNNRRRVKAPGDPAIAVIDALLLWIDVLEQGERDQAVERLSGCPRCPGVWRGRRP